MGISLPYFQPIPLFFKSPDKIRIQYYYILLRRSQELLDKKRDQL